MPLDLSGDSDFPVFGIHWAINVAKSNVDKDRPVKKIVTIAVASVGLVDHGLAPKRCQQYRICSTTKSIFGMEIMEFT